MMNSETNHDMLTHPYELALTIPAEDVEFATCALSATPWAEFWLNPRMLRGSDFLMRWSQGVWSEKRLIEAVNATPGHIALPFGPSGVAPEEPRAVELYFEALEAAGMAGQKRPDLLIFRREDSADVQSLVDQIGGEEKLPFTSEQDDRVQALLDRAVAAIECENSLWVASRMPGYGKPLNEKRLAAGKPAFAKSEVLPTIIIKDEDIARLSAWQSHHSVPIHVWHVFFDRAYGIAFDDALQLFRSRAIAETVQTFQAPGGATTTKSIFKIYYQYGYELGVAAREPELRAQTIIDRNGHVLPYVAFDGGALSLADPAVDILTQLRSRRGRS